MKLILFMVMSMDGVVAFDEATDISKYSSQEDHNFFITGAAACDAAIMGRYSYNRKIKCKSKYLLSHMMTCDEVDEDTIILSGNTDDIYNRIVNDGHEKVALLGGPGTNTQFLARDYVDEIYLTIEPIILGGGVRFVIGDFISKWRLTHSVRLNEKGTTVLRYVNETRSDKERQNRWQAVLHNQTFEAILEKLEIKERERIFCGHGLTHILDTARIMQLMNLEEGWLIPRDIVYAAGLLHDIGRLRQYEDGTPHEKASAQIAPDILRDCGYSSDEIDMITFAISAHRGIPKNENGEKQRLASLLYRADKSGRACFLCKAQSACKWPDDKKNKDLLY